MKKAWLVVPLVAVGLTGCAAMMTDQARAKMRADCEARGLQFVETGSKTTELIVAQQAEVRGMCVGPGDPRYINPPPPPQH